MIALAAGEIADTMAEVEHGNFSRLSCPVSVNEGELFPRAIGLAEVCSIGCQLIASQSSRSFLVSPTCSISEVYLEVTGVGRPDMSSTSM